MAEFTEELEPLFDYRRIQPRNVVFPDDDELDDSSASSPKRRKVSNSMAEKVVKNGKVVHVLDSEEKENEDWLPPPPKVTCDARVLAENSIIKELRYISGRVHDILFCVCASIISPTDVAPGHIENISGYFSPDDFLSKCIRACRLKKQELALFAQSGEDVLQAMEESVRSELGKSLQPSLGAVADKPSKPLKERVKIVISIQNKDELQQFRIYMDDKFERLFKLYADQVKTDLKKLVFCFDGDKIGPESTPDALGMEDNDIIEVHVKSTR